MPVYFIQHGEGGEIKIGTTIGNPYVRMATLQTGAPKELRLLASIPGGPEQEKALHDRFDALRVRGEWFRPEAILVGFIDGLRWAYRDQQPTDVSVDWERMIYGLTLPQIHFLIGAMRKDRWIDRAQEMLDVQFAMGTDIADLSSQDAQELAHEAGSLLCKLRSAQAREGTYPIDYGLRSEAEETARCIEGLRGLVEAAESHARANAPASTEEVR